MYREAGDRGGEATTLNNIGWVYYDLGQIQDALDHFVRVLAIFQEVGDRYSEAVLCSNLAYVLHEGLGRTAQAIEYQARAVQLAEETSHPDLEAWRAYLERLRALL